MLYPKEDKETKQLMYAVSSLYHFSVCMVAHSRASQTHSLGEVGLACETRRHMVSIVTIASLFTNLTEANRQ